VTADIRITFPYVPAEHAEAMTGTVTGRRFLQWIRFCSHIMAGTGLLMGALAITVGREPVATVFWNGLPFLPLVAFWYWGAPVILNVVNRRQFRREGKEEGRVEEIISVGPEGVLPGSKWSHPIPWSDVRRVQETKNLIVVDATSDSPAYLPKHALSVEDRLKVEDLLREQFRDRPRALRLFSGRTRVASDK
jgi:hypothetical protein